MLCISAVFAGVKFLKAPARSHAYSGGSGTESDPYKIASVTDLIAIRSELTSTKHLAGVYFKQTAAIYITATWATSIGTSASYFSGNYDGDSKYIYWDSGTYSGGHSGIFGYIRSATIKGVNANALTGDTGRVTNSTKVTTQGDHKLYARWITN